MVIFVRGFAKSSWFNTATDELNNFKDRSRIIYGLTETQLKTALATGDFQAIVE